MKKGMIMALLLIPVISVVNAYGSYSSFSFANLLESFDPSTIILGLLFIIFLAFLKFVLSKFFKDSEGTANVMAFSIALLMVYGINRMNWDYENFFYDLGLTNDILYMAVPILLIIGFFYIARSRNEGHFLFYRIFLILGAVAIALSFTDFVYEKGFMLTIGIILFLWGLWLRHRHKRNLLGLGYSPSIPNSSRSWNPLSGRYNEWKDYKKQLRTQKYQQRLRGQEREYIQGQNPQQQQAQQQQAQQQQQALQIQKVKIRSLNDLKQKYMAYLFAYYRKGTSPQQQMRMKQALVTIIQMANRQGCDTRTFLSNKIGGSNAKSPNELR